MVTKGDRLFGGRDGLGVWDGNIVKLCYDDGYTTINIITFIELKKKKKDPVLPQLWRRSQPQLGSDPWPWNSISCRVGKK